MASVKHAWIKKYGEKIGVEKYNEHKKSFANTLENYIIRYNGDFWHARKTIFPTDEMIVPRIKKPAAVIRQIDNLKNKIYKNRGFIVITIWDTDWYSNKDEVKTKLEAQIQ